MKAEGQSARDFNPYLNATLASVCNHSFLDMKNSDFLNMDDDIENLSSLSKAIVMSVFGHLIDDPEFYDSCRDIKDEKPTAYQLKMFLPVIPYMFFPQYFINKIRKFAYQYRYVLDNEFSTTQELFLDICKHGHNNISAMTPHIYVTEASRILNLIVLGLLNQSGDDKNVYADFAHLMTHCDGVLSAEVPLALRKIANAIEEPDKFCDMNDEEAVEYLKSGKRQSSKLFLAFIKEHGHRGLREFDVLKKAWRENPVVLSTSLKSMASGERRECQTKEMTTVDELMATMNTNLSFGRKFLFRHLLLPLARRAVGMREQTKSILIYGTDLSRQALWKLAKRMHEEGRIPDEDLLFHLTLYEIDELFIYRNPLFIAKAKQRKRAIEKMDKWVFAEVTKGYKFKPSNLEEMDYFKMVGDVQIKGTPVCKGKVVARVCVAPTIENAVHIRQGDILITYSTDIGWTPYFAMLSGIVTEIGGLVSHGAVIAREHGIPCLVHVEGACRIFKTGDNVLLDSETGVLMRVASD